MPAATPMTSALDASCEGGGELGARTILCSTTASSEGVPSTVTPRRAEATDASESRAPSELTVAVAAAASATEIRALTTTEPAMTLRATSSALTPARAATSPRTADCCAAPQSLRLPGAAKAMEGNGRREKA